MKNTKHSAIYKQILELDYGGNLMLPFPTDQEATKMRGTISVYLSRHEIKGYTTSVRNIFRDSTFIGSEVVVFKLLEQLSIPNLELMQS